MGMATALLRYALNNNLHVAALLAVIIGMGIYALFTYKLSEQSTGYKFNFIGEKLKTIDKNVEGLVVIVADHSEKIIALETVQNKWDKILETKYQKEGTKDAS